MVQMVVKNDIPEKRVTIYFIFILISIIMSSQNILLASEKNENRQKTALQERDTVPEMKMKDINGKEFSNKNLSTWICVYSFGDRKSNEPLQEAVYPASKAVLKRYPSLKIAYINIADLQAVPSPFKYIVKPILRQMYDGKMKRLRDEYKKEGLVFDDKTTRYYMVPDWSGEQLKAFYLEDAKDWYCYISYKNRIYAVLDKDTSDFTEKFSKTVKSISVKIKSDKTG